MDKIKLGIVGMGNMGCGHLNNYLNGHLPKVQVTAICDTNSEKLDLASERMKGDVKRFDDYDEMIRSGAVDSVLIATPHYFHPPMAIKAFEQGLNVLSEKPIGVYTKAVKEMNEAARASGKVFGVDFNQRTSPAYQKLKEMLDSGVLGKMVRATWIITAWFRTQIYYDSGEWRATWAGEGGGVLLNQCPHQIDLMQWICGVPKRVFAKADYGKYHNIEVEDDVTAIYEYENGATGMFMTTTGEYPGTNRFEVSGDLGKVIIDNDTFTYYKNNVSTEDTRNGNLDLFANMGFKVEEIKFTDGGMQHIGILNNFADAILEGAPLLAPGYDGIKGLTVSNAMHLSSWTNSWVDVPFDEDLFEKLLNEKIKNSRFVKPAETGGVADLRASFH